VFGDEALSDPRFADAERRRGSTQFVQQVVEEWIGQRAAREVEAGFAASHAVIGAVYDMDRIASDPGFVQRDNIVRVADKDCGQIAMHGIVPKLLIRPGEVRSTGPDLGSDTTEVLVELGAVDEAELTSLREAGVI
jgi:crotonobetainyl-CoA:carnitine CoA-transferase CaiB-like acyl-CoA transferase